jgi:AhpD family alkylhydroperoxidase
MIDEEVVMVQLEVFDPAMCCSTGVCGPSVEPALATFAADLDWLAAQGVSVRRYNLGQEPGAFAGEESVQALLHEQGEAALPAVLVDGAVQSTGRYPTRDELVSWASSPASQPVSPEMIAELAAIGAAVGSNCEPCFKHHYDKARKLGLTKGELVIAVRTAQAVKDTPATKMLELAAKFLAVDPADLRAAPTPNANTPTAAGADTGCCGSNEASTAETTGPVVVASDEPCCG